MKKATCDAVIGLRLWHTTFTVSPLTEHPEVIILTYLLEVHMTHLHESNTYCLLAYLWSTSLMITDMLKLS